MAGQNAPSPRKKPARVLPSARNVSCLAHAIWTAWNCSAEMPAAVPALELHKLWAVGPYHTMLCSVMKVMLPGLRTAVYARLQCAMLWSGNV